MKVIGSYSGPLSMKPAGLSETWLKNYQIIRHHSQKIAGLIRTTLRISNLKINVIPYRQIF
jgi:hypothetical protein